MTDFALSGSWLSSIFVALAAGWFVGRHARVVADIAGQIEAGGLGPVRACPPVSSAGVPRQEAPAAGACVAHPSDILAQTKSVAWPRAHVFDNMPPVETVRAQAQSILNTESVWDGQSLHDSPEIWGFVAKARVITPDSRAYNAPISPWATPEIEHAESQAGKTDLFAQ